MTEPAPVSESSALPSLTGPGSPSLMQPSATTSTRRSWKGRLWQVAILTLMMVASFSGYLLVLKWRGPDAKIVTHIPLDELIPFQPDWVWVYLIPYLLGPIVIGLVNRDTFHWYLKRGLVVVGLTLLIFIACPTQTVSRSSSELGDTPTGWLYRMMVEVDDPPANAAPSLHVSLTLLLGMALVRDSPRWWPVAATGISLVWLATLFTRQHHLIDVGTGALMAVLVVGLWPRRIGS